MIVVDTNIVSELMRPDPADVVVAWVWEQSAVDLYTTAVTVAEVKYGIERLPAGGKRQRVEAGADQVFATFVDRVLPFDSGAADAYGPLVAERERAGLPIQGFDAQIAAICRTRMESLATRNTQDFENTGVDLINPWAAQ